MASSIGNQIKVQIFGQSHSDAVGVVIDGLPAGIEIDEESINKFLLRRAGGNCRYSTARKEADCAHIVSGVVNHKTCGAPLCAIFENNNVNRKDYDSIAMIPRPSHADYVADVKYKGFEDKSGGGHFSGRLTLPMCFAGAVAMQFLEQKGIYIKAHILAVQDICDTAFDTINENIDESVDTDFPTISREVGKKMIQLMEQTVEEGDSIGGVIECKVIGMPIGVGEPIFDNVESRLSCGMFGIPAVKGIEFGSGFDFLKLKGSTGNDSFCIKDGKIKTKTNHSGGIQGGITNGMPILFRVAVKPTPSIYTEQQSINMQTMKETQLKIEGRHDSCIVPRAVPCIEAMTAVVLADLLCEYQAR